MKTFIEWLLNYKSRKAFGTEISDLRTDTERAIRLGYCPTRGSYTQFMTYLQCQDVRDPVLRAAKEANKAYGQYLKYKMRKNK